MNPETDERESSPQASIQEIFVAAREKTSGEQRDRYLDEVIGDDHDLRGRVERMLASQQNSQPGPLTRAVKHLDLTAFDPAEHSPIDVNEHPQIGPYKILDRLGEGGMGEVFVAEQRQPVQRTVALKLIKRGMDSKDVLARFEAERQALAMMSHPNIASVLDAGQTEDGRPYFVMDLVRGFRITDYCDQHKLDLRERLEIFMTVCQAIQHAHQKGIIHRDLKPGNILVELDDVRHVPKVIDFGVAKATNQRLTERTLFTQMSQMIGTPLYMSPEQAQLNSLDVDTRSDVYSLGVVLYELLTGSTPFDKDTLTKAGYDEMRRIIREDEPLRPSERLSTLEAKALSTISEKRSHDLGRIGHGLKGELDWIVMRALEKDRVRRYESASSFAADIERYLKDEPVEACPPSAAYKFRKFTRHNKVLLITGALVAATLILGIIGTGWQAVRAVAAEKDAIVERDRATDAEQLAKDETKRAENAEQRTKEEAAISKAVNDFLNNDLLAQANPENQPNPNVTLRTVIDQAAEKLETQFTDQPLIEAAIRHTLAKTYLSLGDYKKAEKHAERSLQLRTLHLGDEHRNTLDSMNNLANIFTRQTRNDEAEKLHLQTLDIRRRTLGDQHQESLQSKSDLANSLSFQGRFDEAEKLHLQTLEARRRTLGNEHIDTVGSMHNLANVIQEQKRFDEAEKLHLQTLEIRRRTLGDEHPHTVYSMQSLASCYHFQARNVEAEKLCHQVLEINRRTLGDEHPSTLICMNNLANSFSSQSRYDEAEKLHLQTLEIRRRTLGDEHRDTLNSMYNLANVILKQKRHSEAEKLHRQALEIGRRTLGDDHPFTLSSMQNLAYDISKQNRFEEPEKLILQMLEVRSRTLGEGHPDMIKNKSDLRSFYNIWTWTIATAADPNARNPQKAVEIARKAIELIDTAKNRNYLGVALVRNGEFQEAVASLEKADQMIRQENKQGDRAHRFFLAMAHWQTGDKEMARRDYSQGIAWLETKGYQPDHEQFRFRAEAEELMGLSLTDEDRKQLVVEYFAKRIEADPDDWEAHDNRGKLSLKSEEWSKAAEDFEVVVRLQPKNFAPHLDLLRASNRAANFDRVIEVAAAAVRLNATHHDPFFFRGIAYYRKKEYQKAIADLSEAVRLNPNSQSPYVFRARAFRDSKQYAKALLDVESALKIQPDLKIALLLRAELHGLLGQWSEAAEDFSKLNEQDPINVATCKNLCLLRLTMGDHAGYRQICQQVLDKYQQTKDPALAAWMLNSCKFGPNAVDDLSSVVALAEEEAKNRPEDKQLQQNLGVIYFRVGRYDKAIETLEGNNKIDGGDGWDRYWMAMAHHQGGNQEKAAEWLEKGREWTKQDRTEERPWMINLELELLQTEAETLIAKPAVSLDDDANSPDVGLPTES